MIQLAQVEYIWSGKTSFGMYSSGSGLRSDSANGSSVFALFVLVLSPLFLDDTSDTIDNKEQVLASMVPNLDVRR